jgi:uncharacterized membrane protein YgcG
VQRQPAFFCIVEEQCNIQTGKVFLQQPQVARILRDVLGKLVESKAYNRRARSWNLPGEGGGKGGSGRGGDGVGGGEGGGGSRGTGGDGCGRLHTYSSKLELRVCVNSHNT